MLSLHLSNGTPIYQDAASIIQGFESARLNIGQREPRCLRMARYIKDRAQGLPIPAILGKVLVRATLQLDRTLTARISIQLLRYFTIGNVDTLN